MRYSFQEVDDTTNLRRSPTPKEPVRWIPLQSHPVFANPPSYQDDPAVSQRFLRNFMAWDGESRLYYWDARRYLLHRLSLRLGEPDPSSVLAAVPSKVMQPDCQLTFDVKKISINKSGTAVILAGSDEICVMYLFGRASVIEDTVICRVVPIGSEIYTGGDSAINLIQASWHPDSDAHLGILSSDAVFRLFDVSCDAELPEQEYYLQPGEPRRSRTASSIYPADFSFGGDHLWVKFTVFILFTDGSIYILCPVVPFGSVHKWESIIATYNDAIMYGLKSSNSIAVSNSSIAIEWLEATFPDLTEQGTRGDDILVVKAHPYVFLDASLALQGPLYKVSRGEIDEEFAVRDPACKGRAVSLLHSIVGKDSILVTAWSAGQLQVDDIADEIQPVWISGNSSRLRMNSHNKLQGIAMICESKSGELPVATSNLPLYHPVWLGHPPPLLRLAVVDLVLPTKLEGGSLVTLFADSLLPERIYSLHDGGIDITVLHSFPFTNLVTGKNQTLKPPSVHTVVSTCQEESPVSPLLGFVPLSDPFGYAWIIAVLSSGECIVAERKSWNLLLPIHDGTDMTVSPSVIEKKDQDTSCIISKDILAGPKIIISPHALPNRRPTPADSVKGRSILLNYVKLFHENYVEYAHKVYFELQNHAPNLKRIFNDQHERLAEANQKVSKVEKNESLLDKRIDKAIQIHNSLEQRLEHLRSLSDTHKKPLTKAELDFKSELDQIAGVELDALQSSIKTLRARVKKSDKKSHKGIVTQNQQYSKVNFTEDRQMSQLQSTLAKLSQMNNNNCRKVKIVESALKSQERSLV